MSRSVFNQLANIYKEKMADFEAKHGSRLEHRPEVYLDYLRLKVQYHHYLILRYDGHCKFKYKANYQQNYLAKTLRAIDEIEQVMKRHLSLQVGMEA